MWHAKDTRKKKNKPLYFEAEFIADLHPKLAQTNVTHKRWQQTKGTRQKIIQFLVNLAELADTRNGNPSPWKHFSQSSGLRALNLCLPNLCRKCYVSSHIIPTYVYKRPKTAQQALYPLQIQCGKLSPASPRSLFLSYMSTSSRSSNSVSAFWSLVIVVLLCSLTSQITNPLMPGYCSGAASESWAALHSNQQGKVLWSPVGEASPLSNFEALLPLPRVLQRLYGVKPSQAFFFFFPSAAASNSDIIQLARKHPSQCLFPQFWACGFIVTIHLNPLISTRAGTCRQNERKLTNTQWVSVGVRKICWGCYNSSDSPATTRHNAALNASATLDILFQFRSVRKYEKKADELFKHTTGDKRFRLSETRCVGIKEPILKCRRKKKTMKTQRA